MEQTNNILFGLIQRKRHWYLMTLAMAFTLLLLMTLALVLGNTFYPPSIILKVIQGDVIKGASFAVGTLRLPRMLIGALVGFSFGIAGNTFQTMLRNPLASPDIVGVTAGTSVAAVFAIIILGISGPLVSIFSIVTGLMVAMMIYWLSGGWQFSGGRLILIGIGVQAMLNALISFMMLSASQYDVPAAMRWLSGSLNGVRMSQVPTLLVTVSIMSLIIMYFGKQLLILELGEHSAISLGVQVKKIRFMLIFCSVVLIAFATSTTGPIAFVSFLAGPIANRLVGTGLSNQLPAGLVGSILVLSADLVGQHMLGTRFPAGVITGIIGAPYLIFLLVKMNRTGGSA